MDDASRGLVRNLAFDCRECGRQMISLCGELTNDVCGACLVLPGWHVDPSCAELAALLLPDGQPQVGKCARRIGH